MYELRKNNKYPGFYRDLHNGFDISEDAAQTQAQGRSQAQAQALTPRIQDDLRQLNNAILKKLTGSTRRSPLVKDKIVTSAAFTKYLAEKYYVKGTFTDGSVFLSDHSLHIDRFFNAFDYCTIYENTFMFRISNERKHAYYIDKNLTQKTFSTKKTLHFKFVVKVKKVD